MKELILPGEWLVIGPGSLVGSRFIEVADGTVFHGAGRDIDKNENLKSFRPLDIRDKQSVLDVISNFPGQYVINFAGLTLVDKIEATRPKNPTDQEELDSDMAYQVNVLGTRNIIEACEENNKFPVFISTGFVFDGKAGPYSEDNPMASNPSDVSWYGWTKVLAEREVARSGIKSLNVRISYPYRSKYDAKLDFGGNFLTLYDDVQSGKKAWYPIFIDQTLTPTFVDDMPQAVKVLIENKASGTYNVTSPQICTPYDFCCEILRVAKRVEHPEAIVPKGTLAEFQKSHPEIAKRPLHGGEKVDKIVQLGFTPTNWKSGIKIAFGND